MNGSDPKQTARDLLIEAHPALIGLSHWIHANPELGHQELLASGWVADWMTTAGFEVRRNVGGLETALAASYGAGPLHVALCAEYDALPAVGHACGHNVIAATSVGAAIALASVAEELGLRVTLFGTPAEEGGGGKLRLIEAGEFDGVHAALMVHPGPEDVVRPELLGVRTLSVTYTGREAHAAGFPELGLNAADALTVAQVSIGLLRQHLEPGDRVHGIVTKGGDAPNIVPAHTTGTFMVRSRTREGLEALAQRVVRCFEAGALATGATLSLRQEVAYSPMRHDAELAALYQANAEVAGRWFDPNARFVASTDMGDVSHAVPSIHPMIGIHSRPAVNHQPEFTDAAAGPAADQAILDGAMLLAWTVIDAAQDPSIRERLTGSSWMPSMQTAEAPSAADWSAQPAYRSTAPTGFAVMNEIAQGDPEGIDLADAAAATWAEDPASHDAVDMSAYAGWAGDPAPGSVEMIVTETVLLEGEVGAPHEVSHGQPAKRGAGASETPTTDGSESQAAADSELGEPQQGDDYAAWEADFAAALESLDRSTTSSADGADEGRSGS